MKKVFKLTALLLIAGAMMMTGCKTDPNALPGSWTTTATLYTHSNETRLDCNNYTFEYTSDNNYPGFNYPTSSGSFTYTTFSATTENIFTGFKATAKATPSDAPYGFSFNIQIDNDSNWSYYTLVIQENGFKVNYSPFTGKSSTVIDWTDDEVIKTNDSNLITVYKDKDSSIVININGKNVGIIRNPVLKSGKCGVIGAVTYESYTTNTFITSTYTFKEFQY